MVDEARGEHYSGQPVEGTGKRSSILQFRSALDDGDGKATSDERTGGCRATGATSVASTGTPGAADEGQTTDSRVQDNHATSAAAASKKITMDDVALTPCLGK